MSNWGSSISVSYTHLDVYKRQIISRAREILANLEQGELDEAGMPRIARDRRATNPPPQLGLFSPRDERVIDELRALDVERMTPMDALNALARIAARLKQQG